MAQFMNKNINTASGDSSPLDWPGGPGCFIVQGDFSGATFQLQFQIDGSSWSDVPGAEATHTDNDIGSFQLCPCKLRVSWSGGDSSVPETDVQVRIAPSWQGWWNDATNLPAT